MACGREADAARFAEIGQREIGDAVVDVAHVGEDDAVDPAEERHPQFVVQDQQRLATVRRAIELERAHTVLRKATERRAAAGEKSLTQPRMSACEPHAEAHANTSGKHAGPEDLVGEGLPLRRSQRQIVNAAEVAKPAASTRAMRASREGVREERAGAGVEHFVAALAGQRRGQRRDGKRLIGIEYFRR